MELIFENFYQVTALHSRAKSPVVQCVGVCWSVLECVGVCCSMLQYVAACCSVLQYVAVCCSVLQCVAACCSVLQCVVTNSPACCSVLQCFCFHAQQMCGNVCATVSCWGGRNTSFCHGHLTSMCDKASDMPEVQLPQKTPTHTPNSCYLNSDEHLIVDWCETLDFDLRYTLTVDSIGMTLVRD